MLTCSIASIKRARPPEASLSFFQPVSQFFLLSAGVQSSLGSQTPKQERKPANAPLSRLLPLSPTLPPPHPCQLRAPMASDDFKSSPQPWDSIYADALPSGMAAAPRSG